MTYYKPGKRPLIVFFGDGMVGTVVKADPNLRNELTFDYYPHRHPKNSFTGKFVGRPLQIKCVPEEVVTFRQSNAFNYVPDNGIYLINSASCGRSFLINNLTTEQQRVILNLKKELDIANTIIMDLGEKLQVTADTDKMFKKLQQYAENVKNIRINLVGHQYNPEFQQNFENPPEPKDLE